MLTADRRRAFGPWLAAATALFFALMLADISHDLADRSQNALIVYMFCGAITPVMLLSPLVAAIPFSTGFVRDINSGMAVSMQVRSGRGRFLRSKIFCCALSGGLALAIGNILFTLAVNLWFSQDYVGYAQMISDFCYYDFSAGVTALGLTGYYASAAALQFMAGAFWALVALAVSAWLPNISLTLCAPLILYRLFEEMAVLEPVWLSPFLLQLGNVGLKTGQTLLAALGVYGCGGALAALVFTLGARRRLLGGRCT